MQFTTFPPMLLDLLQREYAAKLKGGLYHKTQIKFAYNSNRIEGSKLTEEQTRYIFETNTIHTGEKETANVDDILETVNHFACFDYMLSIAKQNLSEVIIKKFHKILKSGTSDSKRDWFNVGAYKKLPNTVGSIETTPPKKVKQEMQNLLNSYLKKRKIAFEDIIEFHCKFEKIHPFQDGNGRVGRLIMFKECLKHNIIPFIINDEHKAFYYRGLQECDRIREYLLDTCRSAQDEYKRVVGYFYRKPVGKG